MKKVFISRMQELINGRDIAEFARSIGFKAETIRRYVKGERAPNGAFLYDLCKATGISANWLLGLSDVRSMLTDDSVMNVDSPKIKADTQRLMETAAQRAEHRSCPHCATKDAVITSLSNTLENLSAGRSPAARTSVSVPTKF